MNAQPVIKYNCHLCIIHRCFSCVEPAPSSTITQLSPHLCPCCRLGSCVKWCLTRCSLGGQTQWRVKVLSDDVSLYVESQCCRCGGGSSCSVSALWRTVTPHVHGSNCSVAGWGHGHLFCPVTAAEKSTSYVLQMWVSPALLTDLFSVFSFSMSVL